MDNKPQIELQISQTNQRLDFITEYLQEQQCRQREWDELKGYLTVIGKDVFQTAVKELDEISFCPAPCQTGCNRTKVDDFVGINSVEQYIGDSAFEGKFKFIDVPALGSKKVAIIGGGPAGMSAAYHLRKMGIGSTIFEERPELGGIMRYGIPGYRLHVNVWNMNASALSKWAASKLRPTHVLVKM